MPTKQADQKNEGGALKTSKERRTELEAEGAEEAEIAAILKHEIRKGTVRADPEALNTEDLDRDIAALESTLKGDGKPGNKVSKGADEPDGDEYEGEDGEDGGDEGGDEDEDDDYGMDKGGRRDDRRSRRGRDQQEDDEAREEGRFIRRMTKEILKALSPSQKRIDVLLAGADRMLKSQGRLAVSAGKEIKRLREENRAMREELEVLKGSLDRPESTYKAQRTREGIKSPFDRKDGGVGSGSEEPSERGGSIDRDGLVRFLDTEIRKAHGDKNNARVDLLRTASAEISAPGANLERIAKACGYKAEAA